MVGVRDMAHIYRELAPHSLSIGWLRELLMIEYLEMLEHHHTMIASATCFIVGIFVGAILSCHLTYRLMKRMGYHVDRMDKRA